MRMKKKSHYIHRVCPNVWLEVYTHVLSLDLSHYRTVVLSHVLHGDSAACLTSTEQRHISRSLNWCPSHSTVFDRVVLLRWLALPEVRSARLRRGRGIWDLHPWLPSLQKEDCHVSFLQTTSEGSLSATAVYNSKCIFLSLSVCACACSDAAETVIHSADAFAPVGYLRLTRMHTESKDDVSPTSREGIHQHHFARY